MTPPSPYTKAIASLREKDYSFTVVKYLGREEVEEINVDFAPIMRDTGVLKIRDIVGKEFNVSWMGNGETNNYILIKLKRHE